MDYFATPVSSELPFKNYTKTVVEGIKKSELKSFKTLPETVINDPDNVVRLWGIKFDKISRYKRVNPGDILFFYRKGNIISWCKVLDKFQDKELAEKVWGGYSSDYVRWFTWPHIIVLSKPTPCNIPFERFNSLLGYAEGYSLRSFFKLNDNFKRSIEKEYEDIFKFIKYNTVH